MRSRGSGKSDSWRSALLHTRQYLAKESHVKPQRKSRAGKCSRGSVAFLSGLLDVGDHFSCVARRARRTQAIATENSLRDARPVSFSGATAPQMRKDLR